MKEEVIILDMKISANLLVLLLFLFLWISSVYAHMCVLKFKCSVQLNTENFELDLMLLKCKKTSQNNGPETFLASG